MTYSLSMIARQQSRVNRYSHIEPLLHHTYLRRRIPEIITCLDESGIKFETLVCRGQSGFGVATILSMHYSVPIFLCRKDQSHDARAAVGYLQNNFLVVDDFICTGETIKAIARTMEDTIKVEGLSPADMPCVGILLWNSTTVRGSCPYIPEETNTRSFGPWGTVPVFGLRHPAYW